MGVGGWVWAGMHGCGQVCMGVHRCTGCACGARVCAGGCMGVDGNREEGVHQYAGGGLRRGAWMSACVWDEFSKFLLENRVPTSADFNTHPRRFFFLFCYTLIKIIQINSL